MRCMCGDRGGGDVCARISGVGGGGGGGAGKEEMHVLEYQVCMKCGVCGDCV